MLPISFGPPERYRALNAVASDGTVYVPGFLTSPSTVTFMLLILPIDTLTLVSPVFMFEYPDAASLLLIFSVACSMVSPATYITPT